MNRKWLAFLADFLVENQVVNVVASPGSRNAPLLIHLTDHPALKVYTMVDERSAAFLALGMAQILRKPVALVCTSGSAALNYGPALSEAYYQQVPLLVLSADRPPEWLDQSDGQTIRQQQMFQPYIRNSFVLPVEAHHPDDEWYIWRTFSEAVRASQFPVPGPVHINIPFREPLYQLETYSSKIPRLSTTSSSSRSLDQNAWNELTPFVSGSGRIMILAGLGPGDLYTTELLEQLSKQPQITIFTDITSNLKSSVFFRASDDVIASLPDDHPEDFVPDLLITFGGPILSKKLKVWLRKNKPDEHWHLSSAYQAPDTFQSLSRVIPSDINPFLEGLCDRIKPVKSDYARNWKLLDEQLNLIRSQYLNTSPFSDFTACWLINRMIPRKSLLHLANSMPVRYAHFLNWSGDIGIYANRGVSGIDGCVSTALGTAFHVNHPVTLITGDLSMLYDTHGLWIDEIPANLKLIVLNNGGGGIFRVIDGPGNFSSKRDFFETPHRITMKHLADTFGLEYYEVHSMDELSMCLPEMYEEASRACLLEIFTDQEVNSGVYQNYFKFMKSKTKSL